MSRFKGKIAAVAELQDSVGQAFARRRVEDGAVVAVADTKDCVAIRTKVGTAGKVFLGAVCEIARQHAESFASGLIILIPDILINNLGRVPLQILSEISLQDWWTIEAINVDSMSCYLRLSLAPASYRRGYNSGCLIEYRS